MIPGGARNPRQLELAMRRMGMSTEPIPGVEEVIIRTATKEHVFRAPEVTILTVQGTRTYQVVGTPEVRSRGTAPAAAGPGAATAAPAGPPEEDVRLVMEQANVSREEAIEALASVNGAPAEAILKILTRGDR
ncbi:MAG TPA: nascent polypeptide-associated complex protein [Thermoplasmata archaeon]|nr:nascent polypeptide-associated complex protein [Thermoplasmata archaeon]